MVAWREVTIVFLDAPFRSVRSLWMGAIAGLMLLAGGMVPAAAASIEGAWQTQGGTEVTVVPCGTYYCGELSWIVIPHEHSAECSADRDKFATEMLDMQNPNPTLRSRSLIGLVMMTLKPTGDPNRYDAHIYSSQDGKTYDGSVKVEGGGNTLSLQQCLGICVTVQAWPRVPVRPGPPDFTCGS